MRKMKVIVAAVLVLVMMGGSLTCAAIAHAQGTGNGRERLIYVLSQDQPIRVTRVKVGVNNGVVTARRMDGRRVIWSPCEWVRIDDDQLEWIDPQPYDAETPPATKPWHYR